MSVFAFGVSYACLLLAPSAPFDWQPESLCGISRLGVSTTTIDARLAARSSRVLSKCPLRLGLAVAP